MTDNRIDEPVAVIGAGCRYPGSVDSLESLEELLFAGRETVREVPRDRWTQKDLAVLPPAVAERMRWGCFLEEDVYAYEPEFFGINAQEAAWVDPQQRLLWEVTWEALEHAGIPPLSLAGSRTGLYFGLYGRDYLLRTQRPLAESDPYALYASTDSLGLGRLAFLLDVRGPQLPFEMACASGLAGVHLACQSLRAGEADLALAGGAILHLQPEAMAAMAHWLVFSPTGRCRAFDAAADGYVRGEGCGVVVLKRHQDAQRDGDRILAVLRGSATNQNGRGTRVTAPSESAQRAVYQAALRRAGVAARDVGLVEAHGTGTAVGDPIEFAALASVYGRGGAPCALGAVKTSLGHTEPAAGIAGLLKVIVSLRRGVIPATLNFTRFNPQIDAAGTRLFVPTRPTPWPAQGVARLAAVSAFGISGANVHLIVEEAPSHRTSVRPQPSLAVAQRDGGHAGPARARVFLLSGGTPTAVRAGAQRLADWLEQPSTEEAPENIAYTLAEHRSHGRCRAGVLASSLPELAERLRAYAADGPSDEAVEGTALPTTGPGPVWVFSGHGSQWTGMGADLLDHDHTFTRVIEELEPLVAAESGFSLREVLRAPQVVAGADKVQPTLFAVQLGLAAMWRERGIQPAAVIGHSMGEVAAAVTAGALSARDGVRVICRRSRLVLGTDGAGAMASVLLPYEQAARDIADSGITGVDIAVFASPSTTVVGGPAASVREMIAYWEQRGVTARPVEVDYASHTRHMDPVLEDVRSALAGLTPRPPDIPVYTTALDDPRALPTMDGAYWAANLRHVVRFVSAVRALAEDGHRLFVEISPHPLLTSALHETLADAGVGNTAVIASMHRGNSASAALTAGLAALHCAGLPVAWQRLLPHGTFTTLPPTTWDRRHFEIPHRAQAGATAPAIPPPHPLTGAHLSDPGQDGTHYWQCRLDTRHIAWLADHRVADACVLPGAAVCEMALAAATDLFGAEPTAVRLEDVELHRILPLSEPVTLNSSAALDRADSGWWELSVPGKDGSKTIHATARLRHRTATAPSGYDLDPLRAQHTREYPPEAVYARMRAGFQLEHGPAFAGLDVCRRNEAVDETSLLCELRLPDAARQHVQDLHWHPVTMDICGQAGLAAWLAASDLPDGTVLPVGFGSVAVHGDTSRARYCYVRLTHIGPTACTADIDLLDEDGSVLASLGGLKYAWRPARSAQEAFDSRLLQTHWAPAPVPTPPATSPCAAGRWLVVNAAGASDAARQVARALSTQGATTTVEQLDGSDPNPAPVPTLRRSATAGKEPLSGIAVVFDSEEDPIEGAPPRHARQGLGRLLHQVVQPLLADMTAPSPRLWAITRNAHSVLPGDRPCLGQAGIRSLLRTLSYEHPELHPSLIDTDHHTPADTLVHELLTGPVGQDDVAYRDGARHTARLGSMPLTDRDQQQRCADWARDAVMLEVGHVGDLGSLRLVTRQRRPPAPGEVEIQVRASGLAFANVLQAMGVYDRFRMPGEAPPPHAVECAGAVTAVGPGVTSRCVGDRVAAWILDGSIASFACVHAGWTMKVPDGMTFQDAASLPVGYLSAWYAMEHLARPRAGETVLIHSASGAMGLALIHLARARGTTVFATAGSETKRAFLREHGIRHVMDSRSLVFADQLRELTRGRGVDVVCNTLDGPALSESLDLLTHRGRFIELGKRDIYANTRIGLLPFRRNITFHSVDMQALGARSPGLAQSLCAEVSEALRHGAIAPPFVTTYPIQQAQAAYRTMAAAEHTGKLVLTWPESGTAKLPVRPQDVSVVRSDGSYIITGGLGGLGLLVARWLARSGAAHVVLSSRSRPSRKARELIRDLRAAGTRVDVISADIADPTAAFRLVAAAQGSGHPLRGVLHCAAVVEDATVAGITPDLLDRVWRPKVEGAWHLHHATKNLDLDWWVGFSSAASVLGSPGQGAYSAANAWLDEFITWRRAQGLPATGINWGAWARHGRGSGLEERGHTMIEPEDGIAALEQILRHDRPRTGYSPLQADQWLASYPDTAALEYFADLTATAYGTGNAPGDADALLTALRDAPPDERRFLLRDRTAQHIADVLHLDEERCAPDASLTQLGLDSLRAVEIRNRLQRELHLTFPQAALWTHPTVTSLADYLLGQLTEQRNLLTPSVA
ncbi:type I polyketide synthase [Streptomyces chrestomyceticus]|uniref:type I polyketide synthase n=1 Tax=Streptomyces chrestomyceticus TaxID=68185 RepID=UPI0033C56CE9